MTTSSSSVIKKLLITFLVIIGLYYGRPFLIPLTIGAVMATLFLPFCKWMEIKKTPRGLAVSICLLILVTVISSMVLLLSWQISGLSNDIIILKERITDLSIELQKYIFNNFDITLERQSQLLNSQQSSVTSMIAVMAGSTVAGLINFFLILVYVFGLLYYRCHIKLFLLMLSSQPQKDELEKVIYYVAQVSQQYLFGLSKMIICFWIMFSIGFSIIGVKHAIFFAILCGLLEIVPFVGNITGTLITILVSAVQGAGLSMIVSIIATYCIVQFIGGWILQPIIVGSQVKINPLFTVIALVIGELVWGIPGIFMAIPLIAMFKIVSDHIEPLKPYGFLIGEIEHKNSRLGLIKKIIAD